MDLAKMRWLLAVTCILQPLFLVSHAHRLPVSHFGHPVIRRDDLTLTNTTTGGRNFTTPITPANNTTPACGFSTQDFRSKLEVKCQAEVEAIQACPTSAMNMKKRRELASNLSSCAIAVYRDVYSCARYTVPSLGLPPFESDDRLGAMATYLNPFSDRILGKRATQNPSDCKNPDILPIFEHAITPFHNDTDGRWIAVEKTPWQYLRCAMQVPEAKVDECVSSTIHKLQWLPDRLILYAGQKSCSTRVQLLITTIFPMALQIIHFAYEFWQAKRKRKIDPDYGRSFSWVGLFREVIQGIGKSLLCAAIIRTQFPENSLAASLGLYLLAPSAAPIIASLAGVFLSKGYGTQTLLVDLVSSGAALVLYNLPLKVWTGPMTTFSTSPEKPTTAFLYLGLYLATVPAGIIFFIYQLIILLAVFLLLWSMFAKSKNLAKAAGVLAGLWVIMWIWIVSFAVFAIGEVIWMSFEKKKNGGRYPALESLRTWFSRNGSSFGFFLKRYGYWAWVFVSYVIAAGRWMFLIQLLQLTDGAFCPDSLKSATAASILVTWGAIVANVLLKLRGLAL